MKSERPVNLNLFSIKWPVTALVSISHRVTGVLLFLATAALLYLLDLSLASEAGFGEAAAILATPGARLLGWLAFAALLVHLIAGCRHLLMDLGIGESLRGGRAGAIAVIALSAAGAAAGGLWLW